MRDELVGTQLALQVARAQVMAAGSTLRRAKDGIRAAEGKAREVRGDIGDGDPGTPLGPVGNGVGTHGEQSRCYGAVWARHGYPMGTRCPPTVCVLCTQAERRLQALQGKESRLQRRLRELAQRVTALQQRGQDARRLAQDAKDGAQRATAASRTLSQVSPGLTAGGGRCGELGLTVPCAPRTWRR